MQELTFSKRSCKNTFSPSDRSYDFPLEKPMLCPICGAYQDGIMVSKQIFKGPKQTQAGVVNYKCAHCMEHYLVIYNIDKENQIASFAGFYPQTATVFQNEMLEQLSPGFISIYNQALRAEAREDFDLAAMGYRHALECLVKDYAIKELQLTEQDVIKKSLFDAISDYLNEKELVSAADVVRILGNDYTHYKRKYPEHDFQILRRYMGIFIQMIEAKLLIAHPPVSR